MRRDRHRDAYSDFPGKIADAVRDVYFQGVLVDTAVLYCLEISIRGGGSQIGSSRRSRRDWVLNSRCLQRLWAQVESLGGPPYLTRVLDFVLQES